jgi:hypothetical protein
MDFEDQLAANGCTLKPAEFRRIVLDTFGEEYDPEDLAEILDDESNMSAFFVMDVHEIEGCEGVDDEFIIETLGRLLGGRLDELTPTESMEVASFYQRRKEADTAELKRVTEFFASKFGREFTDHLPDGVTVEPDGSARVEGDGVNPLDPRIN